MKISEIVKIGNELFVEVINLSIIKIDNTKCENIIDYIENYLEANLTQKNYDILFQKSENYKIFMYEYPFIFRYMFAGWYNSSLFEKYLNDIKNLDKTKKTALFVSNCFNITLLTKYNEEQYKIIHAEEAVYTIFNYVYEQMQNAEKMFAENKKKTEIEYKKYEKKIDNEKRQELLKMAMVMEMEMGAMGDNNGDSDRDRDRDRDRGDNIIYRG